MTERELAPTDVVIVDAVRSATAKRNGRLSGVHATDLLGDVLLGLIDRNPIEAGDVDHVAGGCINQVGMQGNNITRTSWSRRARPAPSAGRASRPRCGPTRCSPRASPTS